MQRVVKPTFIYTQPASDPIAVFMSDISPLSVDQISVLLRLYLDWPEQVNKSPDDEANEFYIWLQSQFSEEELPDVTGGLDGLKYFIHSNMDVIPAARFLKGNGAISRNSGRQDARIAINTQVFALVYDCTQDPSLEGKVFRGIMMDMARNGVRLEATLAVPAGSILSMTVAQTGTAVSLYHLTGEIRWQSTTPNASHLGISIFDIEDYQKWQDFYALSSY
jgi:hypothetical protein